MDRVYPLERSLLNGHEGDRRGLEWRERNLARWSVQKSQLEGRIYEKRPELNQRIERKWGKSRYTRKVKCV